LVWDQEGYIEPMGCGVLDEHPEAAMLLDQGTQAFTLLISLTVELTYRKIIFHISLIKPKTLDAFKFLCCTSISTILLQQVSFGHARHVA